MSELLTIDYPTIAVSLLIERFKDSEDLQKLLEIMTVAVMDLQTTVFEIDDIFVLPTATGAELTIIGNIWDVSRRLDIVETDDDYRTKIEVKAVLSVSGTIPEIKKVLYTFYNATYVDYMKAYPAGYHLLTDANITQIALNSITIAGVQAFLATQLLGTTMPFLLGRSVWKSTL